MHKYLALLTVAAALAGLALAPSAGATTTFDLGPGLNPDVAVDENGTGHLVWDVKTGATADTVAYCQVPRGATACAVSKQFKLDKEAIGRSTYVFVPSPNRVLIFSGRCCTGTGTINYVLESTDGGQNFSAPKRIGNADPKANAVFGSGDKILGGSGGTWQVQPLAGPEPSSAAELSAGFSTPTGSSGALFNGTTPVIMQTDNSNSSFSYWTGSGDVNSASTWSGPHPLDNPGDDPTLAAGPAGLVSIYTTRSDAGRTIVARKFDGANFGPPAKISETADPIESDLSANPVTGEFTALWIDNRSPNEWRISRSKDGVTWSAPITIVQGDAEADSRFNLQVAAAADGKGFAVSDGQTGGNITAAPLDQVPTIVGPGGESPVLGSTTVADQEITFFGPGACVQPPEKVTLRVTSKRKKKLARNRRAKISIVVFSVDKTKKTDKKAAFKQAFSTASMTRGSFHNVRAVVTLKPVVKGAFKPKKKTLKGKFNVCG